MIQKLLLDLEYEVSFEIYVYICLRIYSYFKRADINCFSLKRVKTDNNQRMYFLLFQQNNRGKRNLVKNVLDDF